MTSQGPLEKVEKQIESINCRMRKKVPWVGAGVILACGGIIATLTYTAYSGEQQRQCHDINQNAEQVNELKSSARVFELEFDHVKEKLGDLTAQQKEQFILIMKKLNDIEKNGGKEE